MKQANIVSFLAGAGAVAVLVAATGVPQRQSSPAPTQHTRPEMAVMQESAQNPASAINQESAQESAETVDSEVPAEQFSYSPLDPGNEPIEAIPHVEEFFEDYLEMDYEPAKVTLGRQLFHDTRLSADNSISCASCHDLRYGGVDRAVTATGIRGQIGPINTPTVFNSAFSLAQFWDGRASDLEAQADGPPNAEGEMGSNWEEITSKLSQDSTMMGLLQEAFPGEDFSAGIEASYWLEAIAAFERTLITPESPFDKYLKGDESAVDDMVKEGYQVFKDVGCTECHNGAAVGAKSFQPLGRKRQYFDSHSAGVDLGRFNHTGDEADRHRFKVPSLRNVSLTGPWFHDGSYDSLRDAIRAMGEYQLDIDLTEAQLDRLEAFLDSLTGEYMGIPLNGATESEGGK